MMSNRKALAFLLAVFVLGAAAGVLGTMWATKTGLAAGSAGPSKFTKPAAMEWLTNELKLSAEQQQQLGPILDETATSYEAIRERVRPEYDQVRQQSRDRIRAILTPEQKARFEELVRQMDEERARRHREREQRNR
jgi:Spy/CpxP family protein refolding chaperone